ncbi:MAG TPA: Fur family transcriptional regulator [Candidatus Polarisedimenticolia bacterium]|nr:Fur family transcriptional regulator [Candidatus Polarisedimenticolia bacterium]
MEATAAARPLVRALEQAGVRLTGPRREVAKLIEARTGHFTAADLEADPRAHRAHLGRATIFRSLDLLSTLGVIERIDLPNGEHAYVACEPEHHHHVVCSSCGRSSDFDDADLSAVVSSVAARTGYRIDTHRLELFGLCRSCQATEARG